MEKISKICWNDFGWIRPSGSNGKSKNSNSHESRGYGHEEWLLDKSKVINGFHYAFLQPFNLKSELHIGQPYKIWLYTITNKQKFLIGYIIDAMRISQKESLEVYQAYKRNGWLKEMSKQLELAGVDSTDLEQTSPEKFFNIKIETNKINLFDDFLLISNSDLNLTTTRYKLLNKISDFVIEDLKQRGTNSYTRIAGGDVIVNPYHNKMQNALAEILKAGKAYRNIKMEEEHIDLQATYLIDNTIHFFEVKTDTPKNNVRQAIGQLLEYSMFCNSQKANKLIVIGDAEPPTDVKTYIHHLRKITGLNLFYRWIDMNKKILSDEI
jgi:hypothetical protein